MSRDRLRFRGRTYRVQGRRRVNGRDYLLLERLGNHGREKFLAFQPDARPDGDLRLLHFVHPSPEAVGFVKVLQRLVEDNRNFPSIVEYEASARGITLVSTWIRGESLAYRLERGRQIPRLWPSPLMAFRLFRGLAHALHQLNHKQNVVHGDIKPANLIVAPSPHRLVVIDFGSAWTVEQSMKRLAGDGRTDAFASPEQLRGETRIDFRSDQFSSSVVVYLMLTGELPYGGIAGKAGLDTFRSSHASQLVPPSAKCRLRDAMPAEFWRSVDETVLRGLSLETENRFAKPHEWIDALNRIDARLKLDPPTNLLQRAALAVFSWFRSGSQSEA